MKKLRNILISLLLLLILCAAQAEPEFAIHSSPLAIGNLQATIDAAQPGAVIDVPAGLYLGNFIIEKPLTLRGIDWPVLDGQNQGNVLEINNATGVTIQGFVIQNSGARLDQENAGIAVDKSPQLVVENNRLENTLFGIYIKESAGSRIAHNVISSKPLDVPARGDGIRVWYSENSTVIGNHVDKSRDVVLWYNNNTVIRDNVITNGRYGLHFMYCDDNLVENNTVTHNSVGAFLMYSRRLALRGNVFAHNRGPSGYGIGLKDIDGVEATDNLFSSNRVGMYFDNSPWSVDVSQHFSHNAFVYNDIGLLFTPAVKRNAFSQNSFIDNLEQVALTGSGNFEGNQFTVAGQGNFWSDYAGYDADTDGLGDLPYVSQNLFENMMDNNPQLRLFQLSPAQQAVDLAARAFPIFQPKPKFSDTAPLMQPVQPALSLPEPASSGSMWGLGLGLAVIAAGVIGLGLVKQPMRLKSRSIMRGLTTMTETKTAPILQVTAVTKRFGKFTAVDQISFALQPGEAVALWGANGAGKTTIIRAILGLLAYQGSIEVNGYDVRQTGKRARGAIGYVPQELTFHASLTVHETLQFYAQLKGVPASRIEPVLTEVGLADHLKKPVSALSGGLKQRLALASALLAAPPILLLDEPTSNLDAQARDDFIKLLLAQKAAGKTLLFTSHRLDEVATLADRVLVLAAGQLTQTCEQPTHLADDLGIQLNLKLMVPEAARANALNFLQMQGFNARMNGVGIWVTVSPTAKTAPLQALLAQEIDISNFEIENGFSSWN